MNRNHDFRCVVEDLAARRLAVRPRRRACRRRSDRRATCRASARAAGFESPVSAARRSAPAGCDAVPGAVSASATASSTSCGGTGSSAELAHRAAQQLGLLTTQLQGLGGAQPEQVVGAGPHELPRRGIGIGHHAGRQPAHDGHRYRGQLALDQIGRRGDLVGDRDLGDQQLVAVPVDRARRSRAAPDSRPRRRRRRSGRCATRGPSCR